MIELTCTKCNNSRRIFDPIMYLSVPVRTEKHEILTTLDSCLDEYFKEETLKRENKLECDTCRKKK